MNKKISFKKALGVILIPSIILGSFIFWQLWELKKERGEKFKNIDDVVTTFVESITDWFNDFSCQKLSKEIEIELENANYCKETADCKRVRINYLKASFIKYFNKDVNQNLILEKIKGSIDKADKKGCYDYLIAALVLPPEEYIFEPICENNKCVPNKEEKSLDALLTEDKESSKNLSGEEKETLEKTLDNLTGTPNKESFLVYNLNNQSETNTQKATMLIIDDISLPLDETEAIKVFEKVQGGILCNNPNFEYKDYITTCRMEKTENGWVYIIGDAIANSTYSIDETKKEIKISGGY